MSAFELSYPNSVSIHTEVTYADKIGIEYGKALHVRIRFIHGIDLCA